MDSGIPIFSFLSLSFFLSLIRFPFFFPYISHSSFHYFSLIPFAFLFPFSYLSFSFDLSFCVFLYSFLILSETAAQNVFHWLSRLAIMNLIAHIRTEGLDQFSFLLILDDDDKAAKHCA
jgi:hypothetical protein